MVKSNTGKPWKTNQKNKITWRIIPLVNGDPKLTHAATVEASMRDIGTKGCTRIRCSPFTQDQFQSCPAPHHLPPQQKANAERIAKDIQEQPNFASVDEI